MKKKDITFLLTVLFTMISTISFAHDIEVENSDGVTIYYNWINDNTELEVTEASGVGIKYIGDVVIPESVEYDGKTYTVSSIGYSAFYYCRSLYSVEIPKSIVTIGSYAFDGCSSLYKVIVKDLAAWCENADNYKSNPLSYAHHLYKDKTTEVVDLAIPEGVKKVGNYAFRRCYGLHSVLFTGPNTEIGIYAFSECSNLTNIDNASFLTSVGQGAFYATPWYNGQPDGLVYVGKNAYQYKGEMPPNTSIVIKDGTVSITGYTFNNCHNLSSITIPSSVSKIGEYGFAGCKGLTSITIPNSVTSIGEACFAICI